MGYKLEDVVIAIERLGRCVLLPLVWAIGLLFKKTVRIIVFYIYCLYDSFAIFY